MDTIKIEVSVKLNLSEDVKNFVASLVSNSSKPALATPAPAKQAAPAKPAPAPAAPAKPTPTETTEAHADTDDITIEDVRKAL